MWTTSWWPSGWRAARQTARQTRKGLGRNVRVSGKSEYGGRGIRTPEGLHLSGFQDHRHRPLGHPSGDDPIIRTARRIFLLPDEIETTHIGLQRCWHRDRAVLLLVVV